MTDKNHVVVRTKHGWHVARYLADTGAVDIFALVSDEADHLTLEEALSAADAANKAWTQRESA